MRRGQAYQESDSRILSTPFYRQFSEACLFSGARGHGGACGRTGRIMRAGVQVHHLADSFLIFPILSRSATRIYRVYK